MVGMEKISNINVGYKHEPRLFCRCFVQIAKYRTKSDNSNITIFSTLEDNDYAYHPFARDNIVSLVVTGMTAANQFQPYLVPWGKATK